MEWRILPWSSTSWALPMANPSPWNRVQVCFLDLSNKITAPHISTALMQLAQLPLGEGCTCWWDIYWVWEGGVCLRTQSSFYGAASPPHTVCLFILLLPEGTKAFMKLKISKKSVLRKGCPLSLSLSVSECPERKTDATLNMSLQNHFPGNICFQCNFSYEYLA